MARCRAGRGWGGGRRRAAGMKRQRRGGGSDLGNWVVCFRVAELDGNHQVAVRCLEDLEHLIEGRLIRDQADLGCASACDGACDQALWSCVVDLARGD